MSQYFPPYNNSSENIKVELHLSNYATKTDLKDINHVDTSSYALKTNLAALKTKVDKIDTDKLKAVPDDLAKLSIVVKNNVVKKTEYSSLKTKVDNIDTSNYVTKTKFKNDISDLDDKIDKTDKKIPDVSNLVEKSALTAVENKILEISSLATKPALTAVENKIPNVTSFVKKTDFDSKITEVEGKIPNISGLATNSSLTAVENKIPDITSLITKTNFDVKLKDISDRVTKNKSKDLLLDNDVKKLKTLVGFIAQTKFDVKLEKVDDKTKKNASNILGFESRLKQKEDIVDEVQRENSFTRGFYYYLQQSYLVYECKTFSFKKDNNDNDKLTTWKSTGIDNLSINSNIKAIPNAQGLLPILENNGRMNVKFNGNYFE